MKQLAFLFVLLFAMTVYAQESPAPQDSYVDKPQYVEYPSANQPQYAPAPQYGQPQYAPVQYQQYPAQYAQPQYAQPQYAPAPYPVAQPQYPPQYYQQVFYDDSVAYYQNMIEIYTQNGNSKRRTGKVMMMGGGIAAGIGGLMMLGGLMDMECTEDHCDDDGAISYIAGYLILLGGAAVFTTGVVVKIVGGSKLRKAERFRNSLVQYNYRRQHALQLQIEPLINARKGSYGSRLSLNF
ncbi:MAG: hypothetical protein SPM09_10885 [Fibrobacter sp.]|uniref:hypothetical protein n=1 Tax=Fibrobacter sp. TaxID=35828 RepID=UPI002A91B424|nr:hypothetical protein [Fibrobacter sp.]MDY6264903.1 hypothetical protein [Fibrobacter sp.]